ncbi:Glutathione reductase [Elasticomyces elasticus]|nr:Glutathione reductase [Elasticomyces elasticus]KAK3614049.1 Glutathione reductase [Elasticomyces elasticus]KAK4893535.1 Glutathione reductase [Elasticomyces elasticus]
MIKESKACGFSADETAQFEWSKLKGMRDAYVKRLNGIYEQNLKNDNVVYLQDTASFVDTHTVKVVLDDDTEVSIKAKKIRSRWAPSTTDGDPRWRAGTNSDGFFDIKKQPRKVAVVGACYVAVEFADMFHALGTETHLFIRHDTFLRTFVPVIQEKVTAEDSKGVGSVEVDTLLWSFGRAPELDKLNLSVTKVAQTGNGHIRLDKYQNTNIDNIYALGDVCDRGYELTPVAIAADRRLADRLLGGQEDAHLDYSNIPSVVFSHPTVDSLGLTEPAARQIFDDENIKVCNFSFTAMYYSMLEQEEKGPTSCKLVCVGKEEEVVGTHILGIGSDEILQGFGVAIKMATTKADFERCVVIHPTSAGELVTMK